MPVAEFVYADADGRVARQVAGAVPIRRAGNGAVPVPGWTGTYGWRGWRRLDELPRELDPASGTVISANGDRARLQRIAEVLADSTVVDVAAVPTSRASARVSRALGKPGKLCGWRSGTPKRRRAWRSTA
jgi:hypothetical protein